MFEREREREMLILGITDDSYLTAHLKVYGMYAVNQQPSLPAWPLNIVVKGLVSEKHSSHAHKMAVRVLKTGKLCF